MTQRSLGITLGRGVVLLICYFGLKFVFDDSFNLEFAENSLADCTQYACATAALLTGSVLTAVSLFPTEK